MTHRQQTFISNGRESKLELFHTAKQNKNHTASCTVFCILNYKGIYHKKKKNLQNYAMYSLDNIPVFNGITLKSSLHV